MNEKPGDPSRRLDVTKDWLAKCVENHYTDCPGAEPSPLPTRLVDVGDGGSRLPKVMEFGEGETG